MKRWINQVIVRAKNEHSWLCFWTLNEKFNNALSEIYQVSQTKPYKEGDYTNAFWVLDKDGSCVAAQPSLDEAMRYYNDDRVLVHTQQYFV